jgi:hypothetical protein
MRGVLWVFRPTIIFEGLDFYALLSNQEQYLVPIRIRSPRFSVLELTVVLLALSVSSPLIQNDAERIVKR